MLRLAPLLLLAAACKTTPVPAPAGPDACVLGLRCSVSTYMSGGQVTVQPHKVYFVRLPEGETAPRKALEVYESQYHRGALCMLLNAPPGRYALACVVPTWQGRDHFVYIEESIAEQSVIEVKPGEMVFMGGLIVKESRSFSKADAYQKRILQLVRAGPRNPNVWQKVFPREMEFLGEHGSFSRSENDALRTERSMRKALARHGWN